MSSVFFVYKINFRSFDSATAPAVRPLPAISMRHTTYIILIVFLTACKTQQLAVIKLNEKYGCINRKGEIIIQPIWEYILQGDENKHLLVRKDSLYGYIDSKGKIIIKPKFKSADLFSEGLAAVSNGEKYGYINMKGDTIINFQFEENAWGNFSQGFADVILNNKSGYIDKQGNIVIPLIFDVCYPFNSGVGVVMDTLGEFKLVTKAGIILEYNDDNIGDKELLPPRYAYPGSFKTETGQGRVNEMGDTVVPPLFKVTGNLFDGMYIVEGKTGKWGAYNEKGQLVVEVKYDGIGHYSEGLGHFELGNKWGYLDKKGRIAIKPQFDVANPFKNGLAYVEINGKAGFINRKGDFVIRPAFEPYRHTGFY